MTKVLLEARDVDRPVILVAIEPRAYSHAIGTVINLWRPHLDVRVVEPGDLDAEASRLRPQLVLCSQPDRRPDGGSRWVEVYLYPEAPPRIKIRTRDRSSVLQDAGLSDLLSIVDGRGMPRESGT